METLFFGYENVVLECAENVKCRLVSTYEQRSNKTLELNIVYTLVSNVQETLESNIFLTLGPNCHKTLVIYEIKSIFLYAHPSQNSTNQRPNLTSTDE